MKLIIEIPEYVIDDMKECGFIPEEDNEELCKAIDNGTPIPDNATNGDVIKTIFPDNVFAEDKWRDENGVTWYTDIISDNGMTFTDFWWNSTYQKGGTNKQSANNQQNKKCCDTCKHYYWYYDKCNKYDCEVDAKSVCIGYEPRKKSISDESRGY